MFFQAQIVRVTKSGLVLRSVADPFGGGGRNFGGGGGLSNEITYEYTAR
jgi:hypothetical protein